MQHEILSIRQKEGILKNLFAIVFREYNLYYTDKYVERRLSDLEQRLALPKEDMLY